MSYGIPFMYSLKRSDTIYLQNRNRLTVLVNELMVAWGKDWGKGYLGL